MWTYGDDVVVGTDGTSGQDAEHGGPAAAHRVGRGRPYRRGGPSKTQPKVTRKNAARLGLKEKASSFTVNFERGDPKLEGLTLAT